jgi:hypothetical protein
MTETKKFREIKECLNAVGILVTRKTDLIDGYGVSWVLSLDNDKTQKARLYYTSGSWEIGSYRYGEAIPPDLNFDLVEFLDANGVEIE